MDEMKNFVLDESPVVNEVQAVETQPEPIAETGVLIEEKKPQKSKWSVKICPVLSVRRDKAVVRFTEDYNLALTITAPVSVGDEMLVEYKGVFGTTGFAYRVG